MEDEFRLGAKAGLTVLMLGSNAEASLTSNVKVDVIAWARSKGAYAGITLEGSLIKPRHEWNEAYYGRRISPNDIVFAGPPSPNTANLRGALAMAQ